MRLFIFSVYVLLFLTGCHRKLFSELSTKGYVHPDKNTFIMLSAPMCGYSNLAKKTILKYQNIDSLKFIYLEFEANSIDTLDNSYTIGTSNLEKFRYKFFPQFFISKFK